MNIGSLTTALGGLAVVLALVLLAARAARAFGLGHALPLRSGGAPGGQARRLVLAETLALDPRRRLMLVRCDGRDLLVLTGGAQDVLLPVPPAPAPPPGDGA